MGFALQLLWIVLSGAEIRDAASRPQSAPASRPAATTLDLRINPLVDLHFHLRAQAAGTEPTQGAVQAIAGIDRELGGGLAWGLLEAPLSACTTAAEAKELFPQLPESLSMRDGKTLRVRDIAIRLGDALAEAEAPFLAETWPHHKSRLEEARDRISADLLPKQGACFEDILEHFAMAGAGGGIPVYLVVEAPAPGASTHRKRGGGGVCFVGLNSAEGTQLYETILHESIHALDIATEPQNTVLQDLRRRLREAGLAPTDRLFRDVPHTLMFVQAGETIRRVLDPAHKHYGDVLGYYPKVPHATQAVRPAWEAYLRGEITREAAVARIVEDALKAKSG